LDNEPALAEQVAAKGLTVVTEADGKALLQASMGQICAVRGEWEKSADWFLAAALTQPALVDNWLKASTILFPAQHQNMTFAANVLSEAMRMHPNDGRLLYHSALVLHNTGRVAEAVRLHVMTLLAPLPYLPRALPVRADKIPLYEHSIRVDPTNPSPPALSALATAYHGVRRFSEARSVYQRAVQQDPSNVVLLANYARCLCSDEVRDLHEGLSMLQRAKTLGTTSTDVAQADAECRALRDGQPPMMVGDL
jgi:Flp pilus assembly protein TadD